MKIMDFLVRLVFVFSCLTLLLDSAVESSEEGTMCLNMSILFPNASLNDTERCVSCFFPHNCLPNNTCAPGTFGITCERCVKQHPNFTDHYRVGNTCLECQMVPGAIIGFGVFVLLFLLLILINGFSVSLYTKLKCFLHFLQLLYLSFMLKVQWPDLIKSTMGILSFVTFNSDFLTLGCFLMTGRSMFLDYYLPWLTSLVAPCVVLISAFFIDRSMSVLISKEKDETGQEKHWRKLSVLRRLTFFVIIVMYMPVSLTFIQTQSCSSTVSKDVVVDPRVDTFLHNQSHQCAGFVFETFQFLAGLFLIFYTMMFPLLLIFFTLRQRKWSLLTEDSVKYGSVYESYKDRYCFWEVIPMIRKVAYMILTESYFLSLTVQILAQLSLSGIYLLVVIALRPYKSCRWGKTKLLNVNLLLDVLFTLVIGVLQMLAFLYHNHLSEAFLAYVYVTCLIVALVIGVIVMLLIPLESKISEEELVSIVDEQERSSTDTSKPKGLFGRHNKVAPDPKQTKQDQERIKKAIAF